VPCAITGTEQIFRGRFPVPRRVQVAFSRPIHVSDLAPSPDAASELIEEMVWPEVEGSYRRLRARPTRTLRRAVRGRHASDAYRAGLQCSR
jgi:1-acyl-sn-glycerol-3-phosphate acyltransferase